MLLMLWNSGGSSARGYATTSRSRHWAEFHGRADQSECNRWQTHSEVAECQASVEMTETESQRTPKNYAWGSAGNEFEAGLYQGGVPAGMVPELAHMLAHNTIRDIRMVLTEHGDSIVVYFLCKTVQSFYSLGQMIVSGFMHAVFAVAIESLERTTVDVYVRRDEYNLRLLCLSSPQHKGLSVDRW